MPNKTSVRIDYIEPKTMQDLLSSRKKALLEINPNIAQGNFNPLRLAHLTVSEHLMDYNNQNKDCINDYASVSMYCLDTILILSQMDAKVATAAYVCQVTDPTDNIFNSMYFTTVNASILRLHEIIIMYGVMHQRPTIENAMIMLALLNAGRIREKIPLIEYTNALKELMDNPVANYKPYTKLIGNILAK